MIRVHYDLSQKGQKAAAASTDCGKRSRTFEVNCNSDYIGRWLALVELDAEGNAELLAWRDAAGRRFSLPAFDGFPSEEELVTAMEKMHAEAQAADNEVRASRETELRAWLSLPLEGKLEKTMAFVSREPYESFRVVKPYWYEASYVGKELNQQFHEAHSEAYAEAQTRTNNNRVAAEKIVQDRRDAEARAVFNERMAWIAQYGSTRLKRMVQEDIEHNRVYRDERLVLDRPGWVFAADVAGDADDARNVKEEAFALLDEARKTSPSAYLVWWASDTKLDDEGDQAQPGFQCYAAFDVFLDDEIVFFGHDNFVRIR